jgi:uncharacterized protein YceH (UPF0502 family)
MLKKVSVFVLGLILTFTIFSSRTVAENSSYLESRISRLETDNLQLRSQLNQLQSQINWQPSRSEPRFNPPVPSTIPSSNRSALSADPMFNRLATLVIELKERIGKLEAQVADLRSLRPQR